VSRRIKQTYPQEFVELMNFTPAKPTRTWDIVFRYANSEDGSPHFKHYGLATVFSGNMRVPVRSTVSKEILPFVATNFPSMLEGQSLKNKYTMTSKYPLAEYKSIARYGNDCEAPLFQQWRLAVQMASEAFDCMSNSPVLCVGDSFQWCERTTSAGYPWQLKYRTKGELLDSDFFWSWYNNWEISILDGDPVDQPVMIWRGFIKEELKKKVDVDNHLPRTVLASPTEGSILGYRLYGHMNGKLARAGAAFEAPVFVGVNKYGRNWNTLGRNLEKFPNINDGDITKFDGTAQQQSLGSVRDLRKVWCANKRYDKAHDYFYANVVFTLMLGVLGDLYQKFMGQPSGQSNTLVDNCILHAMYWFYHWCLVVVPNVPGTFCTWASFKSHVCLYLMGDDVIYSYSNVVKKWLIPPCIKKTFSTIGVIFKSSFNTPQPLKKLEFCSMYFITYDGIYVPGMRLEKLIASACYKRAVDNPRLTLRRLLALRIEGWFTPGWQDFINPLVDWFVVEHSSALHRRPSYVGYDNQTFDEIMELKWSPYVIESHYCDPQT
jgi:hypothetical protein